MDKLIVALGAVTLIALVAWWFFGKRNNQEATKAELTNGKQTVEITVQGGYKPGRIVLKQGIPAELIFVRKDASACFEEVVLPDFGIKTDLPVGKPHSVRINPDKTGDFQYSCGMQMFFGKITVE